MERDNPTGSKANADYAQGFIDYVEQDLAGGPIFVPKPEDFSTQSFTAAPPAP